MYQQFNEQFAAATRQFADTAAQINRLALSNAQAVYGLQVAAIEERVNATFAFWGEAAETRDLDGLKTLLPKGVQVARESIERAVATSQDVLGRTVKAQEAIGELAKSQFEAVAQKAQATAETRAVELRAGDQGRRAEAGRQVKALSPAPAGHETRQPRLPGFLLGPGVVPTRRCAPCCRSPREPPAKSALRARSTGLGAARRHK